MLVRLTIHLRMLGEGNAPVVMAFAIIFGSTNLFASERPDSFADQVEKLSPAVVNISTTTVVNDGQAMDMPQFPPGSPFEEFLKILARIIGNERPNHLINFYHR